MAKYISQNGLGYLWSKLLAKFLPITGGTLNGFLSATKLTATDGSQGVQIGDTRLFRANIGDSKKYVMTDGGVISTGKVLCLDECRDNNAAWWFNPSGEGKCRVLTQTSDARLKRDIKAVDGGALDAAASVRMVQFQFNDRDGTEYGAVAQEVMAAGLGNLVVVDDTGTLSLNYVGLLCLKVAALEKRVAELEGGKTGKGLMSKVKNVFTKGGDEAR